MRARWVLLLAALQLYGCQRGEAPPSGPPSCPASERRALGQAGEALGRYLAWLREATTPAASIERALDEQAMRVLAATELGKVRPNDDPTPLRVRVLRWLERGPGLWQTLATDVDRLVPTEVFPAALPQPPPPLPAPARLSGASYESHRHRWPWHTRSGATQAGAALRALATELRRASQRCALPAPEWSLDGSPPGRVARLISAPPLRGSSGHCTAQRLWAWPGEETIVGVLSSASCRVETEAATADPCRAVQRFELDYDGRLRSVQPLAVPAAVQCWCDFTLGPRGALYAATTRTSGPPLLGRYGAGQPTAELLPVPDVPPPARRQGPALWLQAQTSGVQLSWSGGSLIVGPDLRRIPAGGEPLWSVGLQASPQLMVDLHTGYLVDSGGNGSRYRRLFDLPHHGPVLSWRSATGQVVVEVEKPPAFWLLLSRDNGHSWAE